MKVPTLCGGDIEITSLDVFRKLVKLGKLVVEG